MICMKYRLVGGSGGFSIADTGISVWSARENVQRDGGESKPETPTAKLAAAEDIA